MIALDAGVVIAYFDEADVHHQAAFDLLVAAGSSELGMSAVNRAEALVGAVRRDRTDETVGRMADIGIKEIPFPPEAAVRLAVLRATTRLKLPDCCVLLTAQQTESAVASFDNRLRSAARSLGLAVLPDDDEPTAQD